MYTLTREEKLKFMSTLNWDYLDKHEDMLAVIEGRLETSGAFTRDKLFVRSLERIPWHHLVGLWGIDAIKELYTPEIAKRLWPKEIKRIYDYAFAILRGEPVSPAGWGTERPKSQRFEFFSNRGYST